MLKNKYNIPIELLDRFNYLVKKIEYARENDFIELYRGYSKVLEKEFEKYVK